MPMTGEAVVRQRVLNLSSRTHAMFSLLKNNKTHTFFPHLVQRVVLRTRAARARRTRKPRQQTLRCQCRRRLRRPCTGCRTGAAETSHTTQSAGGAPRGRAPVDSCVVAQTSSSQKPRAHGRSSRSGVPCRTAASATEIRQTSHARLRGSRSKNRGSDRAQKG
ncbi:hypothetical protein Vafri_997 [Volvox africanus]|nr:hypothetical protein Vafri_997 [Volvox africanus]